MAVDDSYTKLLLHCNSNFVDECGKTVTTYGNTVTTTTQKKFGTHSAYFDGSGDYATIPYTSDFSFGNADFTIDFWLYPVTMVNGKMLFRLNRDETNDNAPIGLNFIGDRGLQFVISYDAVSWNFTNYIQTILTANTWQHIAVVRSGETITLYVNGISKMTASVGTNSLYAGHASGNSIINESVGSQIYMDEIRVSKGIARWTANFTPPTAEYGADVPTGRARRFVQII